MYKEAVGIFMFHVLTFDKADLEKFKSLRIIGRLGVGYNNIDIEAAGQLGKILCRYRNFALY